MAFPVEIPPDNFSQFVESADGSVELVNADLLL